MHKILAGLAAVCFLAVGAQAQNNPLEPGWTLNPESSKLQFQSVKKGTIVETSEFATFTGTLDPTGLATIKVLLDSVDTKVDLRNVRMRFLFFETFLHPEATVTARINPSDVAALASTRRQSFPVTFELDLHGVKKQLETEVVATLITDDMVSIASAAPIVVQLEDFNLLEGMQKLQDAANVTITPSGSVSFDFIFNRNGATSEQQVAAVTETAAPTEATVDEEFNLEGCKGRFEILSSANAIYFASGSARLTPESGPLLNSVIDIIQRCPDLNIVVEGHTDSVGSDQLNQQLSEARAASVASYLEQAGIPAARIASIGFGETHPVAPNDSDRNRARNRRIQFAVAQ
jgi:OmpA-OmpF porin, OOP family